MSSIYLKIPSLQAQEYPKIPTVLPNYVSDIKLTSDNIAQKITEVITQLYSQKHPEPRDITVRNHQGKRVRWIDLPQYEQYEILKKHYRGGGLSLSLPYEGPSYLEHVVPRWTHGLMHATRAALLVRILANLMMKYSSIHFSEQEILITQYLAAFHDSARQAEGVDVWDDESAENAYSYLKELGASENDALTLVNILKDKDAPRSSKHPLSKLIQGADCIDIMRIYGLGGFQNKYLDLYNELQHSPGFLDELEVFKTQYREFIRKTENPQLKAYLEKNNQRYFEEVESLLMGSEYEKLKELYNKKTDTPSYFPQFFFTARERRFLDNYCLVKKIPHGTHPVFIVADQFAQISVFKEQDKKEALIEQLASRVANELTSGLTPKAKYLQSSDKQGTIQPFITLDKELFKRPFETHIDKLSSHQITELTSHMIVDYLIGNHDAHSAQFGVNPSGEIIGIDKGEAYKALLKNHSFTYLYEKEPLGFDPNFYIEPLGIDEPIYPVLCKKLQNDPALKDKVFTSQKVTALFDRIEKMAVEPDYIKALMEISQNPNNLERALHRAKNIKKDIIQYFYQ